MKTGMRHIIALLALALLFLTTPARGAAEKPLEDEKTAAVKVAREWFTSLMQGDTKRTLQLSAVPFSFDGKEKIATRDELAKLYGQVVEKKGKRDLEITSAKILKVTEEAITVEIAIKGDDDTVSVTVKPGEGGGVVGFRD